MNPWPVDCKSNALSVAPTEQYLKLQKVTWAIGLIRFLDPQIDSHDGETTPFIAALWRQYQQYIKM